MFAHLRGIISKQAVGLVSVDIGGAGYRVAVPLNVWETLEEGSEACLWISSYIREDRFDLFGFLDQSTRQLFEEFLGIAGIGPKTALELCSVPRDLIARAIRDQDHAQLTAIKGIGKKTAEKLLVELKSLAEKHPMMFVEEGGRGIVGALDPDAIAALEALGYDAPTITRALKALPADLATTEERVTAVLRNL